MRRNTKKSLSKDRQFAQVLEEAKRRTLIASTASSLRLAGIKVSNEDVEQVIEARQTIEKLLRLKKIERIGRGRATRYRRV